MCAFRAHVRLVELSTLRDLHTTTGSLLFAAGRITDNSKCKDVHQNAASKFHPSLNVVATVCDEFWKEACRRTNLTYT